MGASTMVARRRPIGVAILAILAFIAGLLEFLGGLGLAIVSGIPNIVGNPFPGVTGVTLGVILLILGLITMGVSIGLWRLRRWAWWIMLILMLIAIVSAALPPPTWSGLILPVIVFVYLFVVRRNFGPPRPGPATYGT